MAGHGVQACLVLTLVVAGPHRVLRILVDAGKAPVELMGSIGHELRHAIEVLSDPRVDSDADVHGCLLAERAPGGIRHRRVATFRGPCAGVYRA